MSRIRVVGLCVMAWVLTASGSLAAPFEPLDRVPAPRARTEQRRIERTEIVDAGSGADLRLRSRPGGALRVSLTWMDLDVSKVIQPNGDFHARIAARQDLVVLVRTGSRLRLTRNGETAVLELDRADEDGLDAGQRVLAGSRAVRTFRGVLRSLTEDARGSAPGVALDHLDALLALLQGEPGALDRRAPRRESGLTLSRVACGLEPSTCYAEYEGEVIRSWDDYSQCIDDVRWYPGMQEVCAFTWLLRVESAWFRFIGCSSFPLKAD